MIEPVIIGACTLYHGDNRDVLRQLPDNSIDSVVTDPPYALVSIQKRFANSPRSETTENTETPYGRTGRGFMGQKWDTGETAFSQEFWAEVLRVLKPGGHVAAFGASRAYHRMACAIEDAGFEIRDSLMWVYGTGFPKSQNVAKFIDRELGVSGTLGGPRSAAHAAMLDAGVARRGEKHEGWDRPWMDDPESIVAAQSTYIPGSPEAQRFDGFGTALKPAFEPIVLARKPLSEGTVAANVLRWGTGALNIGACRVPSNGDKLGGGMVSKGRPKASEGWDRPWMHDPEVTERKKGEAAAKVAEAEAQGRWPANVVHDGSDEVVGAFPSARSAGSAASPGVKGTGAGVTYMTTKPQGTIYSDATGSAARFFYSAKASKADRAGSKHPTVKPVALMSWLARLITPPGGTILDPFAGSGTTGAAAVRRGFKAVLCEREDEYVADIKRRLALPVAAAVAAQPANDNIPPDSKIRDLFSDAA